MWWRQLFRVEGDDASIGMAHPLSSCVQSRIVEWLYRSQEACKFSNASLHLAVFILIKFCRLIQSSNLRSSHNLKKYTIASLMLATKYEESQSLAKKVWKYCTAGTRICIDELLSSERDILSTLQFNISTPTTLTFLTLLWNLKAITKEVQQLSASFAHETLRRLPPTTRRPSLIAICCLFIAIYLAAEAPGSVGMQLKYFIEQNSSYSVEEVSAGIRELTNCLNTNYGNGSATKVARSTPSMHTT